MDKAQLISKKYYELINKLKESGDLNYDKTLDYWSNIPINFGYLNILFKLYKSGYKFLDLGCGGGNVLMVASEIGYDVMGVEFDESLLKYLGDYKYVNADITKLNDDFYTEFDVIYCYNPIKGEEGKRYVNKIVDNAKVGAYILTPQTNIDDDMVDKINDYVYKKK